MKGICVITCNEYRYEMEEKDNMQAALHRDIIILGFAVEQIGNAATIYSHVGGKITIIYDKESGKYYFFHDDQPYYFGKVNNREELVRIVNAMKEL